MFGEGMTSTQKITTGSPVAGSPTPTASAASTTSATASAAAPAAVTGCPNRAAG